MKERKGKRKEVKDEDMKEVIDTMNPYSFFQYNTYLTKYMEMCCVL
jgi:HJR/Mrr/RecB family endonuclease